MVELVDGVPWLAIAVGVGVLAHLAGDWPTHGGLPKPLSWLREKKWSDTFGPRWWGVPAKYEAVLASWFFVNIPADLGEWP
ncbi:hypothetical protein [Actinopolymorpha pittospori]